MSVLGTSKMLMAMQDQQQISQMISSTFTSMGNSRREHTKELMSRDHEMNRSMANDDKKRAAEGQADSQALLKDTMQKLDSSASA